MDRRQTLLALLLIEMGLSYENEESTTHHSSIYLLQRSGIELGYNFRWVGSGVFSMDLEEDLLKLFSGKETLGEEWDLDYKIIIKIGILNNRYGFSTSSPEEINAVAAYKFQQLFLASTSERPVQLRGTKLFSSPESFSS